MEGKTWFTNPVASSGGEISLSTPWKSGPGTLSRVASGFQAFGVDPAYLESAANTDRALYMPGFLVPNEAVQGFDQVLRTLGSLDGAARELLNDNLARAAGTLKPTFELESTPGGGWYSPEPGTSQAIRGKQITVRVAGGAVPLIAYDFDTGQPLAGTEGSHAARINAATGNTVPGGAPLSATIQNLGAGLQTTVLSTLTSGRPPWRQGYPVNLGLVSAPFTVSPDTAVLSADSSTVTFTAAVPSPPGNGYRILWNWGDGTTTDVQNGTSASHQYATSGSYTVRVDLLDSTGTRVLGISVNSVVAEPSPHWRITSMQNPDSLDLNVPLTLAILLKRAIQAPSTAMIAVDDMGGGASEVRIRVNLSTSWDASNCCGPASVPTRTELRQVLGVSPTQTMQVGSRFKGYNVSQWSESTTDLAAGSMTGQFANGSFSYIFRAPLGTETGPEFVMRLSATRSGTAMSGTIQFLYWGKSDPIPGESVGYYDELPETYSFPFTAVRIK